MDGFKSLTQAIIMQSDDDEMMQEDLKDVEKLQNLFIDYFGTVYKQTVAAERNSMLAAAGRPTNEQLVLNLDAKRRSIHNDCVIKCEYINRLCENIYEVDTFLPDIPEELDLNNLDDPSNKLAGEIRHQVMDCIGKYVIEKFQQGAVPAHTYDGVYLDTAVANAKNSQLNPDQGYEHVVVSSEGPEM